MRSGIPGPRPDLSKPHRSSAVRAPTRPRALFFFAFAAGLFLPALSGCRESAPPPAYVRLSGPAPKLPEADGRAVLLVFWASWCAPCVEELPSLRKLADDLPVGLRLRTVGFRETKSARSRYFEGTPPPELHFLDDTEGTLAEVFGVTAAPAAFLLVEGERVARFTGPRDWDSSAMRRLLEKLMAEVPAAASRQPKR